MTTNPVAATADDDAALIAFLASRDRECPTCRYNLRGLERPVCPECRQQLQLTVGSRPRVWMLVGVLAPSIFSGISALFLAIPLLLSAYQGNVAPWGAWLLESFGVASAIWGIVLATRHRWFLDLAPVRQLRILIIVWCIHIAATVILFSGVLL